MPLPPPLSGPAGTLTWDLQPASQLLPQASGNSNQTAVTVPAGCTSVPANVHSRRALAHRKQQSEAERPPSCLRTSLRLAGRLIRGLPEHASCFQPLQGILHVAALLQHRSRRSCRRSRLFALMPPRLSLQQQARCADQLVYGVPLAMGSRAS